MVYRILTIDLDEVGWKSSFQIKRGTTRISIKKDVAVGLALRKGQPTFGYLGRDLSSNRSVVVFFPDGKERDGEEDEHFAASLEEAEFTITRKGKGHAIEITFSPERRSIRTPEQKLPIKQPWELFDWHYVMHEPFWKIDKIRFGRLKPTFGDTLMHETDLISTIDGPALWDFHPLRDEGVEIVIENKSFQINAGYYIGTKIGGLPKEREDTHHVQRMNVTINPNGSLLIGASSRVGIVERNMYGLNLSWVKERLLFRSELLYTGHKTQWYIQSDIDPLLDLIQNRHLKKLNVDKVTLVYRFENLIDGSRNVFGIKWPASKFGTLKFNFVSGKLDDTSKTVFLTQGLGFF